MPNSPHCNYVFVCLALSNCGNFGLTVPILPSTQEFAFLKVPAKYLFVGSDNGMTNTSVSRTLSIIIIPRPNNVGRGRRYEAKRFGMFILPTFLSTVTGWLGRACLQVRLHHLSTEGLWLEFRLIFDRCRGSADRVRISMDAYIAALTNPNVPHQTIYVIEFHKYCRQR
jgi:hypothetical protein